MKSLTLGVFMGAIALIASQPAFAASAKNAVAFGTTTIMPAVSASSMDVNTAYEGPWVTILRSGLHTASQKDLVVGVSLECGLFTDTLVKGKGGSDSTSTAEGCIRVRVLLDGIPADQYAYSGPGPVIFARRAQTLFAKLGGVLTGGTVNEDGTISFTFEDEIIQLILDTTQACHFDWVLANVTSGDHTVEVQAQIVLNSNSDTGSASANASIGLGALIVDEVRFVKEANPTISLQ